MKAALFSTCVTYVLIGGLAPFAVDHTGSIDTIVSRQVLIYFALSALGALLLRRTSLLKIGLGLGGMAIAVELLQLLPYTGPQADPVDALAGLGGVGLAVVVAWIGRRGRVQPRGISPPSAAFLL